MQMLRCMVSLSAEQGNAPSQNELGIMLTVGDLIPQNVSQGVRWLEVPHQGDADSQYCLAKIFLGEFGDAYADCLGHCTGFPESVHW